MTLALCLDTGTYETGVCYFDYYKGLAEPGWWGAPAKLTNEKILEMIEHSPYDILIMEDITPQGFIGKTTIQTVKWLGRFEQTALNRGQQVIYLSRGFIKKHLTGKVNKIKDSHIRQAVIDKVYPQYSRKDPGPLAGVTADAWSAVAVGIVWSETIGRR